MTLVNPTGLPPRISDRWGSGKFGASRGNRLHMGHDLQAIPGQLVVSPIQGVVLRHKRPYGDGGAYDDGVLISGSGPDEGLLATLFYLKPHEAIIGQYVERGQSVGEAVSLQAKYTGILDHIHFGLMRGDEWIDPAER